MLGVVSEKLSRIFIMVILNKKDCASFQHRIFRNRRKDLWVTSTMQKCYIHLIVHQILQSK
jgi:hypothetical protein